MFYFFNLNQNLLNITHDVIDFSHKSVILCDLKNSQMFSCESKKTIYFNFRYSK